MSKDNLNEITEQLCAALKSTAETQGIPEDAVKLEEVKKYLKHCLDNAPCTR